ncbi:hypothetical protein MGG_15619 [Pyricularia oryzae 70-15]|uniref:Uncharacterized protein n=1 Tax=Pyricularia oryzae (strain 70-15 / ATCC MYA-4617 / FGSC 8958) TaxID=242507 RepID=G4MW31_PYRO7|nr:uncharacterized protein MGG_15619 [Pyricularia oryzae 70-15]EHA54184.1 hypothetical protein MGG_15619 [Pyricularia oryzae 70-15]
MAALSLQHANLFKLEGEANVIPFTESEISSFNVTSAPDPSPMPPPTERHFFLPNHWLKATEILKSVHDTVQWLANDFVWKRASFNNLWNMVCTRHPRRGVNIKIGTAESPLAGFMARTLVFALPLFLHVGMMIGCGC